MTVAVTAAMMMEGDSCRQWQHGVGQVSGGWRWQKREQSRNGNNVGMIDEVFI